MFYTPTDDSILEGYQNAKAVYASLGLDTERALAQFEKVGISIHSWAGDDVTGFETHEGGVHSENTVTGNYPGRARNGSELRQDLEQAMTWYKKSAAQGYARAVQALEKLTAQMD